MKIYLVQGFTGEYDYISIWNVKAFISKALAQKLAAEANDHAAEYYAIVCPKGHNGSDDSIKWEMLHEYKSPYDPKACFDYTGIKYDIEELEFDKRIK